MLNVHQGCHAEPESQQPHSPDIFTKSRDQKHVNEYQLMTMPMKITTYSREAENNRRYPYQEYPALSSLVGSHVTESCFHFVIVSD